MKWSIIFAGILLLREAYDCQGFPQTNENTFNNFNIKKVENNCGGALESLAGVISYKYAEPYERGERCIWAIKVQRKSYVNIRLISEGFDRNAVITIYSLERNGQMTGATNLTQGSTYVQSFSGPVLFIAFTTTGTHNNRPTTTTAEPVTTDFETTTDQCYDPWGWGCLGQTKTSGTGFLLSFDGSREDISSGKSYHQYFFSSNSGKFRYPISGLSVYPPNEFVSIVVSSLPGKQVVLTIKNVEIPSENGENFCWSDVLSVFGLSMGRLENRLRFCTEDNLSLASISTSTQFLITFNSIPGNLEGRGGFTLSWKSISVSSTL